MNLPVSKTETGRIEVTRGLVSIVVGVCTLVGMLLSATAFVLNKNAKIENAAPMPMLIEHMRSDTVWQQRHEVHDAWQDSIIIKQQAEQKAESERGRALNCYISNNPIGFCDDVRQLQRSILQRGRP